MGCNILECMEDSEREFVIIGNEVTWTKKGVWQGIFWKRSGQALQLREESISYFLV